MRCCDCEFRMQCDEREQVLTAFVKCYKRDAMLANKTRNAAPATNADRIRAMTDEELAEFVTANNCPPEESTCEDDCKSCWLAWLQQPYKGGRNMMDYHELIDALTDEDNPNVLDYINDAVETLEHLYSELRAANTRCETLSKMVTQYQDELIPGYRGRAEKAEAQLSQYTASGLEPCDYTAMRSAIDGEKNAKQSLSEALRALSESNARAEKAERERDDAVEQLHHCENSCDYCASRRECDKESCFGPSPKTGEPIDYWSWDKNA